MEVSKHLLSAFFLARVGRSLSMPAERQGCENQISQSLAQIRHVADSDL